jgi:hypothetical protein
MASPMTTIFDYGNHIFMIAVEGLPTTENINQALDLLVLPTRKELDVLVLSFWGAIVPLTEVRKELSGLGVSVVMGEASTDAVTRAISYRTRLLTIANQSPLI